jgi:hypothetical protein
MPARDRWFAEVLRAGLDTKLMSEQDVLAHATPAVLTAALPREVMVRIFDGALAAGAMSPKAIVETATVDLLAEKVPSNVTWGCITAVAERAGIKAGKPKDEIGVRELIRRTLASALSTGMLTPAELLKHVDAKVLGTAFPDALTSKLLEVTLASGKITPEIVVETLGVDAIAKHAPVEIVWAAFVKPGEGSTAATAPTTGTVTGKKSQRALEVVDDDVASILVDLEEDDRKSPHRATTTKPS